MVTHSRNDLPGGRSRVVSPEVIPAGASDEADTQHRNNANNAIHRFLLQGDRGRFIFWQLFKDCPLRDHFISIYATHWNYHATVTDWQTIYGTTFFP
jgi:hypothetical protein